MMKICKLREKLTMRFLTYGNVISSFIFITALLAELLVYVSNDPIVFSGMNQRSTTHQGEYFEFFLKNVNGCVSFYLLLTLLCEQR
jgi:hypothetical protein